MSGGFVGISKQVSEADLSKAKADLENLLKSDLLVQATAQVPEDFVLYPNLVQITYTDLPQSAPSGETVTINERADFYGVMFKRSDLANYLASRKITDVTMLPVVIPQVEKLDISYTSTAPADLVKTEQIDITITGSVNAVSNIPEDSLKTDLAGAPKDGLSNILRKYPNILTASATVRPFWKGSFPDASQIDLVQIPLK
jgi:hypothetical protein